MTSKRVEIYDTTLRDGSQGEGVSFSVKDKLAITERLDQLGIGIIEGGWPGANPRDTEFFESARSLKLKKARLAAFGMTARPGRRPSEDAGVRALVAAETPVVTIVAKTWDKQVKDALRIGLDANRELIASTVRYLAGRVDTVILDAEHFFDGYLSNPAYALACVKTAVDEGAKVVCLCDTRGGSLPALISDGVRAAAEMDAVIGIHCHNDAGLAVANSLAAVEAGARQVQGTINGFGERCGNANLCAIIPSLQLKMGYRCMTAAQLRKLTEVSRFVFETANIEPDKQQPYVGRAAFAHKGGLHVSAIRRSRESYEHVDPALVGNEQRVLISDLAGRSSLEVKAKQLGLDVEGRADELASLLTHVKELEKTGFQFEGADASLELLLRANLKAKERFFRLIGFRVIDEKRNEEEPTRSEATVMIEGPNGEIEHTAATGNGPVHALDRALRKALVQFFPELEGVQLHDYKVRVLDGHEGTAGMVRVFIESGDGNDHWGTVGVSHNVVEASWQALVDSILYKLHKDRRPSAKSR
ncbi:MAG: citramalate synthase [Deltaproteobacteria bacterium]|nr:MAG: citramalate synthase [Deltaproteobacteria bacterium]